MTSELRRLARGAQSFSGEPLVSLPAFAASRVLIVTSLSGPAAYPGEFQRLAAETQDGRREFRFVPDLVLASLLLADEI